LTLLLTTSGCPFLDAKELTLKEVLKGIADSEKALTSVSVISNYKTLQQSEKNPGQRVILIAVATYTADSRCRLRYDETGDTMVEGTEPKVNKGQGIQVAFDGKELRMINLVDNRPIQGQVKDALRGFL
jgi:hypothetical protein